MILGGPIAGHIQDAIGKTAENGGSFLKNLQESVKETITEDMPGTSGMKEENKVLSNRLNAMLSKPVS